MLNFFNFALISLGILSINFFSKYNMNNNLVNVNFAKNNINNYELILDVRTKNEYDQGHYPSAINIPHNKLIDNKTILNLPLNTSVLVYCRTGIRAGIAVETLKQMGFTNVQYFKGGFDDLI